MDTSERLLRWASGIMVGLGAGHLTLASLMSRSVIGEWFTGGAWAAVPLLRAGPDSRAFWGGLGSFSVPLILLGCLIWHLAGRGVPVPATVGWVFAAWCLIGGVLLVPSPYFAGVLAGALVIAAARKMNPGS